MNEAKKLYRSRNNRIIAGVCAGLARYFDIDAWIVRLIFITLMFADGVAILVYIILIFAIPEEPADTAAPVPTTAGKSLERWVSNRRNVLAYILIGLGVIFLLKQIVPWPWLTADLFWPLIIIVVGAFLIIKK